MRLTCIDDDVPSETMNQLRAAAETAEIGFDHVVATAGGDAAPLPPGSLLYRPATSAAAMALERRLFGPGVATFHTDRAGPLFGYVDASPLFARAGLPCPARHAVVTGDRDALRAAVARLGGLPVVVKLPGWSGGVGTLRADSLAGLFSLVDLLLAQGNLPWMMAYVPQSVSWRVVVVGGRAVAACRNAVAEDDFRSHSTEAAADHTTNPPPAIARLAVRAVRALRLELGGVDILAAPDGALWLLESNFPCYFAHAHDIGGIDVAGAMVAHLVAKAGRMRGQIIRASNGGSRSGASNSTTQRSGSRFTARAT